MTLLPTSAVGYMKDTSTNMVINTNKEDFHRYKAERARVKQIRSMQSDIDTLTKLVNQLVSKGAQ